MEVSTQFAQRLAKTDVTSPPLIGCVVWNHLQGLGMYILGIPYGNSTDDVQGGWKINNQLCCTCLKSKSTRHQLHTHPIFTE